VVRSATSTSFCFRERRGSFITGSLWEYAVRHDRISA
jgi:hypothetical protein